MAIADKDVVPIERWLGLRNTEDPSSFELGDLDAGANVDITDAGKLRRRKGYSAPVFAGSWRAMALAGDVWLGLTSSGELHRLYGGAVASTQLLRSGLTGEWISAVPVGSRVYYSDGAVTGCIDSGLDRTWGLEPPTQPVATATGGSLVAGTYQYALTYVRRDGQESGTPLAGRVTLDALGGIAFSAIALPGDPDVIGKNLYVSAADGDKLYLTHQLALDETSATLFSAATGLSPLRTQHLGPPRPASCLGIYKGRILGAAGSRLVYTEAYAPELMDRRLGFDFPEDIAIVAPVRDGVWVATGKRIVFLSGDDPAKFEYDELCDYGAIPGTLWYASAPDVEPGVPGKAAMFVSTDGIVACLNGGIIKNVTRDRYSLPIQARGAGVVRSHGGMTQYLTVLEGTETTANVA